MNLATTVEMSATLSSLREGSMSSKLDEGARSSSSPSLLTLDLARAQRAPEVEDDGEGEDDLPLSSSGIMGILGLSSFGLSTWRRPGLGLRQGTAAGEASGEPSGECAGVGAGVGWPAESTVSASPQLSASLPLP